MTTRGGWKFWAGIGVSLFLLVLLFRDVDTGKFLEALRRMDWRYVIPALASTMATYWLRAIRWKYLVSPIKKASMSNLFPCTIIGYMANNLLPARMGELVRAYLLAEREDIGKGASLGTLVVDRLLDGLALLAMLVITMLTLRLPPGMESVTATLTAAGYGSAAAFAVAVLFLLFLSRKREWVLGIISAVSSRIAGRHAARISGFAASFAAGLMPEGKRLPVADLAWSTVAIWITALWPVDLVLRSFGLDLPPTAPVFIMVLLVFAVMVPASPGYVGTYHAACVYGLMAFGLPREESLSIAIVLHAMNFIPVTILGLLLMWRGRISLGQIEKKTEGALP